MTARRTFAQTAMEWQPLVRIYESRLWRRSRLFEAIAGVSFDEECRRILAAGRSEGDRHVLDLASGSGLYARRIARANPGSQVMALDLSRPMLRHAVELAREESVDNVACVRASALALPCEDARFDWVNCCGALHLFPDADQALREIARVLAPQGRFTAAVFRRGPSRLAGWVAERRRRALGVDAYTFAELSSRLADAGLERAEALHDTRIWLIVSARRAA